MCWGINTTGARKSASCTYRMLGYRIRIRGSIRFRCVWVGEGFGSKSLCGGEATQEQAEEFVGVDFYGDFCVGLEVCRWSIWKGEAGFERRRIAHRAVEI